jgi:hypothetical protein
MGKKAIIEELRSSGAVAAHPLDRWVSIVRGSPRKVTWVHPLYMDKRKLGIGDKIAIVDTQDYATAFICRVTQTGYEGAGKETFDLSMIRTIELS